MPFKPRDVVLERSARDEADAPEVCADVAFFAAGFPVDADWPAPPAARPDCLLAVVLLAPALLRAEPAAPVPVLPVGAAGVRRAEVVLPTASGLLALDVLPARPAVAAFVADLATASRPVAAVAACRPVLAGVARDAVDFDWRAADCAAVDLDPADLDAADLVATGLGAAACGVAARVLGDAPAVFLAGADVPAPPERLAFLRELVVAMRVSSRCAADASACVR